MSNLYKAKYREFQQTNKQKTNDLTGNRIKDNNTQFTEESQMVNNISNPYGENKNYISILHHVL